MTTGPVSKRQLIWVGLSLLAGFLGVCTIFALVVTAAEGWTERAQAQWPQVTARVDKCDMRQSSSGRRDRYYIRCRLVYAAGAEQNAASVYSKRVPGREVQQYPPNQIEPLEEWLEQHPQGTPIDVHYDPDNHSKIAVVESGMLVGGPRTASNLKVVELFGGGFLVLVAIALIVRPRSVSVNENS